MVSFSGEPVEHLGLLIFSVLFAKMASMGLRTLELLLVLVEAAVAEPDVEASKLAEVTTEEMTEDVVVVETVRVGVADDTVVDDEDMLVVLTTEAVIDIVGAKEGVITTDIEGVLFNDVVKFEKED